MQDLLNSGGRVYRAECSGIELREEIAGSSLVCPLYADAFNLFVFNQLTSSFSMKSSAGWVYKK